MTNALRPAEFRMNAVQLAKEAENKARPLVGILAPELLQQIKLAHVATWVEQVDNLDAETVIHRAREAMASIRSGEFA